MRKIEILGGDDNNNTSGGGGEATNFVEIID